MAPYLTLMREDSPRREHAIRDLFDALQYVVKTGCTWRSLPHDLPPWSAVYQQARRWLARGIFEQVAHDLRVILRLLAVRECEPSAAIFDARTLESTPERGCRAAYDGHKKKNWSIVHAAVDTIGILLAAHVTGADEQDRMLVEEIATHTRKATGGAVKVVFVDQGYSDEQAVIDPRENGMELIVIIHNEAKWGFILLPTRWVVEWTFAWLGRFCRLARDYERLPERLAGWHWVAAIAIMLAQLGLQSS